MQRPIATTPFKSIDNQLFFESVCSLLGEGRCVELTVRGNSMRPFLRDMVDSVVVESALSWSIERGMVVLFKRDGRMVLHRIRSVEGDLCSIVGDAVPATVESVAVADVVAVVTEVRNSRHCFAYRSARWRWRSFRSLAISRMRLFYVNNLKKQ